MRSLTKEEYFDKRVYGDDRFLIAQLISWTHYE